LPGLIDYWYWTDKDFFWSEAYVFQSAEIDDQPETRHRTLGYHWQIKTIGRDLFRAHIVLTVDNRNKPQIEILYTNEHLPISHEGWKKLIAHLREKGPL